VAIDARWGEKLLQQRLQRGEKLPYPFQTAIQFGL
jgi:hypothetical protein